MRELLKTRPGWGRPSVYFADGCAPMCTPSNVSFSPLFSNDRYQEKAVFLTPTDKGVISLFSYEFFTL